MNRMADIFGGTISTYTRQQAIEDGTLVDVSTLAREAGFRWPVAITRALHTMIDDPPQGGQDYQGRLWDVLWMASLAAKRGGTDIMYRLILRHGRQTYADLHMVCGPGDDGEPVVTIMLPDED